MRLIFIIFSLLILLLGGAIIGPSFIDWNKHKEKIVAQVKSATGLEVKIDGDLSLKVIPSPSLGIENMTVVAPLQKNFENLVTVKRASVSVALMPLLKKEVKVSSITLIEPNINLEIMEDGTPSWTTPKMQKAEAVPEGAKDKASEVGDQALEKIALDRVKIEKGELHFINHQTGANHKVSKVDTALVARSLKGPFDVKGGIDYQGQRINFDAKTGRLPKEGEGLTIDTNINLPASNTNLSFNGVTSVGGAMDVQGTTKLSIENPTKLGALVGGGVPYAKPIKLDGVLTANEESVSFDELKLSLGEFTGSGKASVQNLKARNPMTVAMDIKSSNILDLSGFQGQGSGASDAKKTSDKEKEFVPNVLTLPMPINANVKFDLGGMNLDGKLMKGVFLDVNKEAKNIKATYKILEMPGQAKSEGNLSINYASSSQSSKTGQVTLSDPTVSYAVNGQINQLAGFIKAFAPDADASKLTDLYKTAQYNLKGSVSGNAVALKDSTLKLDQTVIGLGGRYAVPGNGARARAAIDISASTLDFDNFISSNSGGGAKKTQTSPSGKSPTADFSLPLDLDFDVSIQNAKYNGQDLSGIRLDGSVVGQKLSLKQAAVNSFAGANISAKGTIANIQKLSGMDMSFYTKTSNVGALAKALKVDVSKLPANLNALELSASGQGSVDAMAFDANVKALGGQLDAKGQASNLLNNPSYKDLTLGIKHSNLVKAIQIFSPDFAGQAGLQQAINFSTGADIQGKKIDLSNMKVTLGETNFSGNLKIDSGATPVAVNGNISAGSVALDSLLGAKTSSGGSSSKSSGGTWSKDPIDLSFMNDLNTNIDFKANSITYGAWNLSNPSTNLKIANGQMAVNNMKVGVFGGSATMTTLVKASPLSVNVDSAMSNIDLERLAKALSGSSKLKTAGTVDFKMGVQATGGNAHALVNNLNGGADLNGTSLTIKGFDLVKLARGLASEEKILTSAVSLVTGAMSGGQTKFDTVKGAYKITNGKVDITSMAMDNTEAVISSTGYTDLPTKKINVNNTVTLKNVQDLEPFNIKIEGSLNNPKTLGTNILQDYAKKKFQSKIADKLPDVLGDKTTEKLKKLGIVGEKGGLDINNLAPDKLINNFLKPKTEEKPAPANDNTAPAPTPAAEPAPAPVKEIKKPEDALKSILDSGSAEDAVNGLIKGLF